MNTTRCLFGGALFAAGLAAPANAQTFQISQSYGFIDGVTPGNLVLNIAAYNGQGNPHFIEENYFGPTFNAIQDMVPYLTLLASISSTAFETIATITDTPMPAYAYWDARARAAIDVSTDLDVLAEWQLHPENAQSTAVRISRIRPGMDDELLFDSSDVGFSGSQLLTLAGGSSYRVHLWSGVGSVNLDTGHSAIYSSSLTIIPAPGTALAFAGLLATRRRRR